MKKKKKTNVSSTFKVWNVQELQILKHEKKNVKFSLPSNITFYLNEKINNWENLKKNGIVFLNLVQLVYFCKYWVFGKFLYIGLK